MRSGWRQLLEKLAAQAQRIAFADSFERHIYIVIHNPVEGNLMRYMLSTSVRRLGCQSLVAIAAALHTAFRFHSQSVFS